MTDANPARPADEPRRVALRWLSTLAMGGSVVAAYGTLAGFIGRFVYPARPAALGWMFVRRMSEVAAGESFVFRLPSGSPVNVTRRGTAGSASDFLALSSTCPHLGCQVHWETQNTRFFCPCHNGVFDPSGRAISGPPADAGQSLLEYPLKGEGGILFIEVPLDQVALGPGRIEAVERSHAGHDPCLARRART
jgi:cytochrome b6-f complex iron-sulfur subunit